MLRSHATSNTRAPSPRRSASIVAAAWMCSEEGLDADLPASKPDHLEPCWACRHAAALSAFALQQCTPPLHCQLQVSCVV